MNLTINATIKLAVDDDRLKQAVDTLALTGEELLEQIQQELIRHAQIYIGDWNDVDLTDISVDVTKEELQCLDPPTTN